MGRSTLVRPIWQARVHIMHRALVVVADLSEARVVVSVVAALLMVVGNKAIKKKCEKHRNINTYMQEFRNFLAEVDSKPSQFAVKAFLCFVTYCISVLHIRLIMCAL